MKGPGGLKGIQDTPFSHLYVYIYKANTEQCELHVTESTIWYSVTDSSIN